MSHNARNFTNEPIVQANVTEAEYINVYQAKKDEKAFVQHSPLLAVLKQTTTLKGQAMEFVYKLSNSATTSAGYVHCASTAGKSKKLTLVSKKLYVYQDIDGETMEIFKKDPESVIASFSERFLDDASMAFRYNLERQLMCNDLAGTGILDTVTAVAGSGTLADPYVADLAADSIVEKFNCGDLLHSNDDGLDGADKDGLLQLKIVEVIEADANAGTPVQLKLVGNPSVALAAGAELYKASSKGHELIGLRGLLKAVAGDTVYGTTLDPQMTSTKLDASTYAAGNRGVSSRMFRDMFRKIKKKVGEYPDLVITSHEVFRDLEEIMDGSKTFFIQWDSKTKQGIVPIGFNGVEFVIGGRTIRVVESEYLKKSDAFIVNTKHMELKWRNGGRPRWDDRDGEVFRTTTCDDSFSGRMIAYGEFMANVGYMGIIENIETSDLLAE